MDRIQDEAKKQIKIVEGKYMDAFEEKMKECRQHYESERSDIVKKFEAELLYDV